MHGARAGPPYPVESPRGSGLLARVAVSAWACPGGRIQFFSNVGGLASAAGWVCPARLRAPHHSGVGRPDFQLLQ